MAPDDVDAFGTSLRALHRQFQARPFHYVNEYPVVPELYRLLRDCLSPETVPVEYRQAHSDMGQWRNRRLNDEVPTTNQRIPRIRPEVTFYREKTGIWGGAKSDFDLAVFAPDDEVVLQGKKEGVGGFIDVDRTRLSILCEIKHSMNMSGQFRSGGETDVQALAEYPGPVERRYFVFVDWWPRDGYGNVTYEKDVRQLEDRLDGIDTRVDVAYLPRNGDLQFVREVG